MNIKVVLLLSCIACWAYGAPLTSHPTSASISLADLAKQYFAQSRNTTHTPAATNEQQNLTVDWLINPRTQQTLFTLKQQLGVHIDQQQPIQALTHYGVMPHRPTATQNSYLIDLNRFALWADAQNLFQPLSTIKQLNKQYDLLRRFGFTNKQLAQLAQHLTQYPQQQNQDLNQLILKRYIINQANRQQWSNIKTGQMFVKHSKHLRFTAANLWAQSTLGVFSPNAQQKLIDYLQQQLGLIAIIRAPISLEEFNQIGLDLRRQHQRSARCQAKSQAVINKKEVIDEQI